MGISSCRWTGEFPKETSAKRKEGLEQTIGDLEREQEVLNAQLAQGILTGEQMESIAQFAASVAASLDTMEETFERQRDLIDLLDLRAALATEDGVDIVHAECMLGEAVLPIAAPTTVPHG